MSAQTIKVYEIMVEQPVKGFDRIRVEVSYDKGGWNGSRRGYSMMAFPAKVEAPGVMTIGLFTGSSVFLQEVPRFKALRLKQLANDIRTGLLVTRTLVEQNAAKNGMVLKGDPIYLDRPNA